MKKHALVTVMLAAAGGLILAGCDTGGITSSSLPPEPTSSTTSSEEVDTYTVSFYNQDEVIHTVEVDAGDTVEEWDPSETVTDATFGGWYIEPSLVHPFDFTTPITANTNIYGRFTTFVEDERTWAIAGSGVSSILTSSSWGVVVNEEHKLVKEESTTENIYAITVDLFVGDQFQFMVPVYGENGAISWGNQRGGAYMNELTLEDGTEVFNAGGGLSGSNAKANFTTVLAGNYTLKLHTYPQYDQTEEGEPASDPASQDNYSSYDYIEWVRNGDTIEEQTELTTEFFIKGAKISEWQNYINSHTLMALADDEVTYTLDIYLESGDEVMFASRNRNNTTLEYSMGNDYIRGSNIAADDPILDTAITTNGGNMTINTSGNYSFTYHSDTGVLDVEVDETGTLPVYAETYINGNFDNDASWANKIGHEEYQFTATSEDPSVYTLPAPITLNVGEELGVQIMEGEEYGPFWSFDHVLQYNVEGTTNEYFEAKNEDGFTGNIVCKVAGTYEVSFSAYSQIIKLTPAI